jgi:hypothetical protein
MAVGEHEAIAVEPVGILGIELEDLREQHVAYSSHAHWGTGVSAVGLGNNVDSKAPDAIRGGIHN